MKKTIKYLLLTTTCALFYVGGVLTSTPAKNFVNKATKSFSKPKISVVMSTYNRAKSLPTAIESILDQTYKDFELIIIDDGSSDNTQEIVESYAKNDSRIVFLKNEKNSGLVYSLNRGLDVAKGEYIARMDDDDKSVKHRFERQVLAMDEHPDIIVMGSGFIGNPKLEEPQAKTGDPVVADPKEVEINSYFSSALAHPTIMIRNSFLKKHKIHYSDTYLYAEDCDLYRQVLNNGGKISSLSEPLLYLGYHKGEHPHNYSYTQMSAFSRLQKKKMEPFFTTDKEIFGAFTSQINKCYMLQKMVEKNPELKIVDQSTLEKHYNRFCPKTSDNAIYLVHKDWSGFLVLDQKNKKAYRLDIPKETAQIQEQTDKFIRLYWDNWKRSETFYNKGADEYRFVPIKYDGKSYSMEHPYWNAEVIISKDKKLFRVDVPDETGKVIKEDHASITVKWDHWEDKEVFKKQGNKLIYLKDTTGKVKKID